MIIQYWWSDDKWLLAMWSGVMWQSEGSDIDYYYDDPSIDGMWY